MGRYWPHSQCLWEEMDTGPMLYPTLSKGLMMSKMPCSDDGHGAPSQRRLSQAHAQVSLQSALLRTEQRREGRRSYVATRSREMLPQTTVSRSLLETTEMVPLPLLMLGLKRPASCLPFSPFFLASVPRLQPVFQRRGQPPHSTCHSLGLQGESWTPAKLDWSPLSLLSLRSHSPHPKE